MSWWGILIIILIGLLAIELILHIIISKLRKRFDTILTSKDVFPELDKKGLEKFFKTGYDPELGWARKPNTSKGEDSFSGKKTYHINALGSRTNPGHEKQKTRIITFGDSFTFCREVNDNETWQHYLANLTNCNVANFGVGNYGLDQAYLRFKKELSKNKQAKIAIIGVVPETIQRNLTIWKHYSEPGNTFGFKPRFILKNGELELIPNPVDTKEKFFYLERILPIVNKYDYFYEDFKESIFTFPYTISILKRPKRNILLIFSSSVAYLFERLKINWRKIGFLPSGKVKSSFDQRTLKKEGYYQNKSLTDLTIKILQEFNKTAKRNNLYPIFMMMPQQDDLEYIQKKNKSYYEDFIKTIRTFMECIDFAEKFRDLKDPFSFFHSKEYSKSYKVYGGHYNGKGNMFIAKCIHDLIKQKGIKKW